MQDNHSSGMENIHINFVTYMASNSPDMTDQNLAKSTAASLADVDELKQCLIDVWNGLEQSVIEYSIDMRSNRHRIHEKNTPGKYLLGKNHNTEKFTPWNRPWHVGKIPKFA